MEKAMGGIVLPVVAAFVGLVAIVGAVIYYGSQQIEPKFVSNQMAAATVSVAPDSTASTTTVNHPRIFDQAAFEASKYEGEGIFLYFTASWCSECDFSRMRLEEESALWPSEKLDVFLVDFKSEASSTDPMARLAEDFEVIAPDTKILLRGEELIERSTEVWSPERYREAITSLLK